MCRIGSGEPRFPARFKFPPSSSVLLLSVVLRPAHPLLKKLGSESGLVMIADAVELIDSLFSALNASFAPHLAR
jgi:hypothetical protein